jgi:hypothetical protein
VGHSWMRSSAAVACCALGFLIATGCAHVKTESDNRSDGAAIGPSSTNPQDAKDPAKVSAANPKEVAIRGVRLKNTGFDIPIVVNSRVEFWVDYFCGRGRANFERYLERSEFFVPYIVPLLKQNGLPEDMVYLAMIESGFNNNARSRAKAVGPWQFISATGKRYGLMVNWWVDERRDTRKSTLAAVEYLKDLYNIFQSWELAAAAYNAGEAKIARAVQRYGTKDFWALSRYRFLRPETRDYVPKIIAAALISKNRTLFGFAPSTLLKASSDEAIAGDGEVVKLEKESEAKAAADAARQDEETLAGLLKDESDSYEDGSEEDVEGLIHDSLTAGADPGPNAEPGPLAKPIATPQVSKTGEVSGETLAEFEVQSPADLLKVARAAGLAYHTVKSLNPEVLRWCTPPTVGSYRLRLPVSVKDRFLSTYNHEAFPRKVQFMTYKVRQGDNLNRIARHFGIRVDPISDLNGVSPRVSLRNGTRVLLPMPNDRTRNLASLDVRDAPQGRKSRRHKRYPKSYKVTYKKREAARGRPLALGNDGG